MKGTKRYDIVIIGGGVGGLNTASAAAHLGARVAMVEKKALGGDCLYHGCVPSKTFIRSASAANEVREASRFGVVSDSVKVDFSRVMERVHRVIETLGVHDSPERFRKMGIDVFFGEGGFRDPETFVVGDTTLTGKNFVIATGSGPFTPPIPGLDSVPYQTNLTIFNIKKLPASMVVLGGGPIGVELGQAFRRLGSEVTLIEMSERILSKEDPEISSILEERLKSEGIKILARHKATAASARDDGMRCVTVVGPDGQEQLLEGEELLVVVGRKPSTKGLNLEAAGVETNKRGYIKVDRRMRTTQ